MSDTTKKKIIKLIEQIRTDGLDAAQTHAVVTDQLRGFSESIGASREVEVMPITVFDGARPLDCFNNCVRVKKQMGGDIVYGWDWHQMSDLFVVAEFHSVWRAPDDQLIDITPRTHGHTTVTFSIDPNREAPDVVASQAHKAAQSSFRFALTDNPVAMDWIAADAALSAIRVRKENGEHVDDYDTKRALERAVDARQKVMAYMRSKSV